MRGWTYRAVMSAVTSVAIILVFWQSGLLKTHPFAVQKLTLLCICTVCTLLIAPLITRNFSAPASAGIFAVTALFDIACIIITCLKSDVFWVPVIVITMMYILLLLSFLLIFAKAK